MAWFEIMKFVSKCILLFPIFASATPSQGLIKIDTGLHIKNIESSDYSRSENQFYFHKFQINHPFVIEFTKEFDGKDCLIDREEKCANGKQIILDKVNFDKPIIEISYLINNKKKTFFFHQFPINFPKFKFVGTSNRKEDFIFSWAPKKLDLNKQKEFSYLFVISPTGKLKFFQNLPFTAVDFRPHRIGNKLFFSYLKATAIYPLVTIEGHRHLFSDQMQFIHSFPELLDFHDFQLIDTNHFIGITYEVKKNVFDRKYIEQKIIEIKNRKKVFEWSVDEFAKLNPFPNWKMKSTYQNQNVVHQYHLNHIQNLGDQLLISLGFECVILLNKKTKKITWVFGGGSDQFGLSEEISTSLHHTPILDLKNSTLTLFDNGVNKRSSRVLQYKLDLEKKKIIQFKQVGIPYSFSAMMGSVEELNQNYTIGFGTRDFGTIDILEIENNKTKMSLSFDSPDSGTYKIYRSMTRF